MNVFQAPFESPRGARQALRQTAVGPVVVWLVASILGLVVWDVFPSQVTRLATLYVVTTSALATWAVTRALLLAHPTWTQTAFDQAIDPGPSPSTPVPEELERVQRAVRFSRFTAVDAHVRLRPILQETTDALLTARYGRGLSFGGSESRLNARLWEWVRPNQSFPDRDAPGVQLRDLTKIVASLEELANGG
jgi:hypothetical protein